MSRQVRSGLLGRQPGLVQQHDRWPGQAGPASAAHGCPQPECASSAATRSNATTCAGAGKGGDPDGGRRFPAGCFVRVWAPARGRARLGRGGGVGLALVRCAGKEKNDRQPASGGQRHRGSPGRGGPAPALVPRPPASPGDTASRRPSTPARHRRPGLRPAATRIQPARAAGIRPAGAARRVRAAGGAAVLSPVAEPAAGAEARRHTAAAPWRRRDPGRRVHVHQAQPPGTLGMPRCRRPRPR